MRHTDYFKNFLDNTVNLSKFKLETLSGRVDTIYGVLKADASLGPLLKKKIPQGSWPQKTIINPQNGKAFDGDFMVQMEEDPEWADDLRKYGNAVYDVLHRKSPYKDMPHGRKCRCVYVNYADNAMHVDIVPFVVRSDGTQWIVNRDDNKWERTDTEGFTNWMKKQDKAMRPSPPRSHPDHEVPPRPQELLHRDQVHPAHDPARRTCRGMAHGRRFWLLRRPANRPTAHRLRPR